MGAHTLSADAGAASRLISEISLGGHTQPMLGWDCASLTDTGLERAHNEDSLCLNIAEGLMILADGMGGYNAGEVASAIAIEEAGNALAATLSAGASTGDIARSIELAISAANGSILKAAARRPECLGMGTTLVVAAVRRQTLTIGHVGDSRVYLLRKGHLARLTHDHSVGQAMIDAGVIDEQAARLSSLRGVLTRALGVEATVDADISQIDWNPGDRLLICSDGLTDMIGDPAIRSLLGQSVSATDAASALVRAALDAGGHDNVSVIVALCQPMRLPEVIPPPNT